MIRLNKIENWVKIPKAGITLPDKSTRTVRLSLNSEGSTRLDIETAAGKFYLATVTGNETLEFKCTGEVTVNGKGDPCHFMCDEIHRPVTVPDEVTTFTKIVEPRQRNPELELMMAKLDASVQKRMNALEQASAAKIRKTEARALAAEQRAAESLKRHEAANNTAVGATAPTAEADRVPESAAAESGSGSKADPG